MKRNTLFNFLLLVTIPLQSIHANAVTETQGCVSRTIKEYKPKIDLPQFVDKYKHCTMSCVLALNCGTFSAWGAGVAKEIVDVFGPGNADAKDLRANSAGIRLVRKNYARTPDECSLQCNRIYPSIMIQ